MENLSVSQIGAKLLQWGIQEKTDEKRPAKLNTILANAEENTNINSKFIKAL